MSTGSGVDLVSSFWSPYLSVVIQQTSTNCVRIDYSLDPAPTGVDPFSAFLKPYLHDHYVDPQQYADELAALGDPGAAKYIRSLLPTNHNVQLGDLGEIVLAEYLQAVEGCEVPIRRLRNKDHPEMSLRGTDALGLIFDKNDVVVYKGEAKGADYVKTDILDKALASLRDNRGDVPEYVLYMAMRSLSQDKCAIVRAHLHFERRASTRHVVLAAYNSIVAGLLDTLVEAAVSANPMHIVAIEMPKPSTFVGSLFENVAKP